MSEKAAARTREKWVDDVKVIACIWLYWAISSRA